MCRPAQEAPDARDARGGMRLDKKFRKRVKEAVANSQVRLALDRATSRANRGHAASMASIDWEGLRRQLRAVKEASIRELPDLARQFREEAEKSGAKVYEAADASAARSYALELAKSRGVKLAVKSKSMLTEELELNRYLEAAGVKAVETDLGEWIIQLAEIVHSSVPPSTRREEIARRSARSSARRCLRPTTMTKLALGEPAGCL